MSVCSGLDTEGVVYISEDPSIIRQYIVLVGRTKVHTFQ